GALGARVHRGTVTATRIRWRMGSIMTTFGDIEMRGELLAGGRYELRSFHGNVAVHTQGPFTVDASSRDGRIAPEIELRDAQRPEVGRLVGSYGSGDRPASLVLSSTVGRVGFGLASE